MATGTYTADTRSTVFLLISRPSLLPALLILRPTMALDTPPMVVAIEHHDRNVRSFAAGHQQKHQKCSDGSGAVLCSGVIRATRSSPSRSIVKALPMPTSEYYWSLSSNPHTGPCSQSQAGHSCAATYQSRTWVPHASALSVVAAVRHLVCGTWCRTRCPAPGPWGDRTWCPPV